MTFKRLLETYLATAPRGVRSFIAAMQVWLKEKLFLKFEIKKNLIELQQKINGHILSKSELPKLLFSEHHLSHAGSAFYPSPFKNAAILCMDGVGEWATTSAWLGNYKNIKVLWEINFPHSLGLLYSTFTYYCGFRVNSEEYKLMGLALYGQPKYSQLIKDKIIDIKKLYYLKIFFNNYKFKFFIFL